MEIGMPTQLVQTNLARLAVIEGGILRDIYAVTSPSIFTYERYVDELERWLSTLPPSLRLHTDHTGSDLRAEHSRSDRGAIVSRPPSSLKNANGLKHNLELVYLDSILLVTRPLLLESTLNSREPNSTVTQLNTRLYAQTWYVLAATSCVTGVSCSFQHTLFLTRYSVDAANQISHLSSLMKSQELLAKKSWPTM